MTLIKANENNIELVTSSLMGGLKTKNALGFKIEEEKIIEMCPAGYTPEESKYDEERGQYEACFNKKQCLNCSNYKNNCPCKIQKKKAIVCITRKMLFREAYIKKLGMAKYKKLSNMRNGVEAIFSLLRRRYRMNELPIFGLWATKLWLHHKIGALNFMKLLKGLNALKISNAKKAS
jgi:hypothetical protein